MEATKCDKKTDADLITDLADNPELFEKLTAVMDKAVAYLNKKIGEQQNTRVHTSTIVPNLNCLPPNNVCEVDIIECLPWLNDNEKNELKRRAYQNRIQELQKLIDDLLPKPTPNQ